MKRDISAVFKLISRNIAVFAKDKVFLFTSLITPLILLALFVLFLKNVYISSFENVVSYYSVTVDDSVADAFANHWLMSSIFAASCVTMAFCVATIMVDDRITGAVNDIRVSPVKEGVIALAYLISTFIITFVFMLIVFFVGLIYLAITGFYLAVSDVFLCIAAILLLSLFGAILANISMAFVKSQGTASAIATLVSSMYGFICGAYMPISSFPEAIQNFVIFIPGTYGSNILRMAFLNPVLKNIDGLSGAAKEGVRDGFDINMYFFDNKLNLSADVLVLVLSCAVLLALYLLLTHFSIKKKGALKPKKCKAR